DRVRPYSYPLISYHPALAAGEGGTGDPPPRTDLARTMTWPHRGSAPNPARFFIKKRGKKFCERSIRFAHGKNMLPDTGENGTMVTGTLTPIGTLYYEEEGRPHGRGL